MKKLILLAALIFAAISANAQNFIVGGGAGVEDSRATYFAEIGYETDWMIATARVNFMDGRKPACVFYGNYKIITNHDGNIAWYGGLSLGYMKHKIVYPGGLTYHEDVAIGGAQTGVSVGLGPIGLFAEVGLRSRLNCFHTVYTASVGLRLRF